MPDFCDDEISPDDKMILVSTLHDPDSSLLDLLQSTLPTIKELFFGLIVCLTPETHDSVENLLVSKEFNVNQSPNMSQVETYRNAFKEALKFSFEKKLNGSRFFYIDLDRLVHWIKAYPDELLKILSDYKNNIECNSCDFLHIGRTPRAFLSHPSTQTETESIVNMMGSKALGKSKTIDILSVCYIITSDLLEKLIDIKNRTRVGFYCTWPIFLWNWASNPKYIEVEGHEWETPDRYSIEIEKIGYEKWMEKFQSQEEWGKRVHFIRDCLEELNGILKIRTNSF